MVLAALGYDVTLHCTLGRDDIADKVEVACRDRGIELIIDRHDEPTPQHLNIMDNTGGRYSIFLSNGADAPVLGLDRLRQAIAGVDTVFLSLAMSSKVALPLLKGPNIETLLDLHDYDGRNPWYDDFISYADVLQLSDVALAEPIPVIRRLLAKRAKQVVLTKGGAGAEIFTSTEHADVPVCPANMVDSNGAGDAFSVALWHGQRIGMSLEDAGCFAASAAAFAIEDDCLFPPAVSEKDILERA